MADSEQIQSLIKDLEEMKDGLGSLNDLMEGTQQVSDSLLKSFQNFATTGSSSTLWGAVSRFSSGIFPGFWSLQNKVRAVAVYMQYVEKKQKEQIQAEGKIAKTIRDQSKVRNEAFRVFELLQKDSLSITEQITLEGDAYYTVLKAQLGAEEAKVKYQEAYKDSLMENINGEFKLSRAVGERIRNEEKYAHLFESISLGNMKNLEKVLFFKEQEEEAEKRLLHFTEEKDKLYNEKLMRQFLSIDLVENSGLYEREQEAIAQMDEKIKLLDEEIKKQELIRNTAKGTTEIVSKETGVSITNKSSLLGMDVPDEVVERDDSKSRDELIAGITEYVTKYIKSIPFIAKAVVMWKWLGKKNNRKLLLSYAVEGLRFMRKMLLGFLGVGLVVFAIIQSGIIGRIIEFIEYAKGSKIFKLIMKFVTLTLSGLYDIFDGIFTFFYGLFTGDTEKVIEGIKTFGLGALKLIGGLIMTAVTSIMIGLPSLLIHVGLFLLEGVYDFFGAMFGSMEGFAKGTGALMGAFKGAAIGGVAGGPLGLVAGALIGGGLGYIGGAGVSSALGLASGGRVNQGGNILVGEAGPEIVSLPTNSFVTPAVQSRAMMGNNITVQVNGRVGASDSELNEIARKIGQKINREMNKYGSSGYRA